MADAAHTPLPWDFEPQAHEAGFIGFPDGSGIYAAFREADGFHIVKCVNAHDDLVNALETLRSDCQTPIDMYERNGPEFTSPHGNEYESTSYVMAKFAELVASIDAALARAGGAK